MILKFKQDFINDQAKVIFELSLCDCGLSLQWSYGSMEGLLLESMKCSTDVLHFLIGLDC